MQANLEVCIDIVDLEHVDKDSTGLKMISQIQSDERAERTMSKSELVDKDEGHQIGVAHIVCSKGQQQQQHDSAKCDVCILLNTVNQVNVDPGVEVKSKPRIQAVPKRLREVKSNSKCFDPVFVSIGPYHHGKPEYQFTQKIKYMSARRFISGDIKSAYDRVASLVPEARQSYADDGILNKFSDTEFANMMFLDGCFILDSIYNRFEWIQNGCSTELVIADLLLLENQLPYFVLKALVASTESSTESSTEMGDHFDVILYGILMFIDDVSSRFSWGTSRHYNPNETPIHLLDLFRTAVLNYQRDSRRRGRESYWDYVNLGFFKFGSAKELKAQGINFRRTSVPGLDAVKFSSGRVWGEVSLPRLVISESTKSLLLNLAAYEMCPDSSLEYGVTNYICLMGSLISDAQDVKELSEKDIIFSSFSSNDQVADIFNQLPTQLPQDLLMYVDLAIGLGVHRKKKLAQALVGFVNTNFTSWTSIGVAAAASGLLLTLLQTIYTMRP